MRKVREEESEQREISLDQKGEEGLGLSDLVERDDSR
jgi:hypothetical protein